VRAAVKECRCSRIFNRFTAFVLRILLFSDQQSLSPLHSHSSVESRGHVLRQRKGREQRNFRRSSCCFLLDPSRRRRRSIFARSRKSNTSHMAPPTNKSSTQFRKKVESQWKDPVWSGEENYSSSEEICNQSFLNPVWKPRPAWSEGEEEETPKYVVCRSGRGGTADAEDESLGESKYAVFDGYRTAVSDDDESEIEEAEFTSGDEGGEDEDDEENDDTSNSEEDEADGDDDEEGDDGESGEQDESDESEEEGGESEVESGDEDESESESEDDDGSDGDNDSEAAGEDEDTEEQAADSFPGSVSESKSGWSDKPPPPTRPGKNRVRPSPKTPRGRRSGILGVGDDEETPTSSEKRRRYAEYPSLVLRGGSGRPWGSGPSRGSGPARGGRGNDSGGFSASGRGGSGDRGDSRGRGFGGDSRGRGMSSSPRGGGGGAPRPPEPIPYGS